MNSARNSNGSRIWEFRSGPRPSSSRRGSGNIRQASFYPRQSVAMGSRGLLFTGVAGTKRFTAKSTGSLWTVSNGSKTSPAVKAVVGAFGRTDRRTPRTIGAKLLRVHWFGPRYTAAQRPADPESRRVRSSLACPENQRLYTRGQEENCRQSDWMIVTTHSAAG